MPRAARRKRESNIYYVMIRGINQQIDDEDDKKSKGFGWNRWSRSWLYQKLKLYNDYKIRYYRATKALPER